MWWLSRRKVGNTCRDRCRDRRRDAMGDIREWVWIEVCSCMNRSLVWCVESLRGSERIDWRNEGKVTGCYRRWFNEQRVLSSCFSIRCAIAIGRGKLLSLGKRHWALTSKGFQVIRVPCMYLGTQIHLFPGFNSDYPGNLLLIRLVMIFIRRRNRLLTTSKVRKAFVKAGDLNGNYTWRFVTYRWTPARVCQPKGTGTPASTLSYHNAHIITLRKYPSRNIFSFRRCQATKGWTPALFATHTKSQKKFLSSQPDTLDYTLFPFWQVASYLVCAEVYHFGIIEAL